MTAAAKRLVPSRAATLFARAAELCPPARRTTPDQWGAENREYPASSGMPGPRDPWLTPYLIPFGRAITSRRYRRVVGVTSAQSGKTETLLDCIGQRLDQAPAPILYVGPSKQFVSERFEPRVMALLDEAPTLARKVTRGKRMSKTRKMIAGVPLILAHGGSSTALKSDPFAVAMTDEADELVANLKGQGDPLALIDARGDSYADFVHAIVSTPSHGRIETETDPVSGLEFWTSSEPEKVKSAIWRAFLEGTRHHWAWRCPHCEQWFIPRRACLHIPDVPVPGEKQGSMRDATAAEALVLASFHCSRCGAEIEEEAKTEMNARGVAVAPGQTISDDGEVLGEHAPNDTYSLFASGLCSPFKTFRQRASAYAAARASGLPDRVQTVINAGFGEPHVAGALRAVKWQTVRSCCQPYSLGEVPREAIYLVAGVDVQKRSLYYVIRGFGAEGASWLIQADQLHGLTAEDEVWDTLASVLTMPYGGMNVRLALVDSGFRPDKLDAGDEHRVYEFCRRWKWLAKPTKGRQTQTMPLVVKPLEVREDGRRAPYSIDLVTVDTDHFKSLIGSRMLTAAGRPGAFGLPSDVSEAYCRQMVSEVREIVAGKPKWTQITADNHWFDCEALAAAAGRLLNVERIPRGSSRDWDPEAPPPLLGVGEPAPDAPVSATPDTAAPASAGPAAPAKPAKTLTESLKDTLAAKMAMRSGRMNGRAG